MSEIAAEELLSEEDAAFLKSKEFSHSVTQVDGFVHVVIHNYQMPKAYSPQATDLLLRLPPNFPLAHPDMFWTFPHVRLQNGQYPDRADQFDVNFQERRWQRWSRHIDASQWRPGTDNLKTFLGTIKRELEKGV